LAVKQCVGIDPNAFEFFMRLPRKNFGIARCRDEYHAKILDGGKTIL
jgi:hypothetical protein